MLPSLSPTPPTNSEHSNKEKKKKSMKISHIQVKDKSYNSLQDPAQWWYVPVTVWLHFPPLPSSLADWYPCSLRADCSLLWVSALKYFSPRYPQDSHLLLIFACIPLSQWGLSSLLYLNKTVTTLCPLTPFPNPCSFMVINLCLSSSSFALLHFYSIVVHKM